jgi:hypothetical protein
MLIEDHKPNSPARIEELNAKAWYATAPIKKRWVMYKC